MRRVLTLLIAALACALPATAAAQAVPSAPVTAADNATGWYLALGDSLSVGYQPTDPLDKRGGYTGPVLDALRADDPKTQLRNLGCAGATTTSLMGEDRCSYDQGSQLAAAVEFLEAHKGNVDLVTIDVGANDVTPCARPTINVPCVIGAVGAVQRNLTTILAQLRAATGPDTEIIVLNYYNPFLAAWLTGQAGQVVAAQSSALLPVLNGAVAAAAASAGADVADVATAFRSSDTTPVASAFGTVPTNVATICALTWMCTRSDIHANDAGYAVLAGTVIARLG